MPQVIKTVNETIVNALYLTGELGVGETPDGFMLETGLDLINQVLGKFTADSIYIPFLKDLNFNFVQGQDTYSFSDIVPADVVSDRIVDLSFANFEVPTTGATKLIYPLQILKKANYYNVIRQNNLQTRPAYIFLNRQETQSLITVYPVPDQPYPCFLKVKLMLDSVENQSTLIQLPPMYYGFLKYAIARAFLAYYPSANWPQQNEDEYQDFYNILKNTNETDLTITPSIIFNVRRNFFWPNILSMS